MLKLHTFGGVYLERDGVVLDGAAGQRRVLALLVVLAAAPGGGVSRDRLLGLLWSEADEEKARHALTQALYNARRALRDEHLFLAGSDIRLNPESITSDVGELVAALERSDDTVAADLYRGSFLDGFLLSNAPEFEQWAAGRRGQLASGVAAALDRVANAAESRGDVGVVLETRRRRAALDPLDSAAALSFMKALASSGDTGGAVRHARVHETLVREQLDVAPHPEIVSLAARLKDGPPAVAVTAPTVRRVKPAPSTADTAPIEPAAPTAATIAPKNPLKRSWLPRRVRWIGAGALIAAAVVVFVLLREHTSARPANAAVVGAGVAFVAPFRVAGADPSLAYLREGIVELLSARLSDDPTTVIDPGVVLSQWNARPSTAATSPNQEAAEMAARLGAQAFVIGTVVGNPSNIVVTASIVGAADGKTYVSESVQGPADSVTSLLDGLAVRLLAARAGEVERFRRDQTPPLASLKAYLSGQAAYRAGHFTDAVDFYERALDIDSTFALAAFRLSMAADRVNAAEQHDWALAAAWRHRASLNRRDQAHLEAFAGPRYPSPSPEAEQVAAWERATVLAPGRAEVWQELGERFFYDGPVIGAINWRERATAAFKRAMSLDPTLASARAHLILLAAHSGDTASLSLLARASALKDSVGDLSPFLSWRVAAAREDEAELRRFRDSFGNVDAANLRWIAMSSLFDAVGVQDGERALRVRHAKATRAADELDALLAQHGFALNQGRPVYALDLTEQLQEVQPGTRAHLRLRVLDALYADGDRAAAERAVVDLARSADASPVGARGETVQLADVCVLEQWRLARGELGNTRRVIARLRNASPLLVTVPVATPPRVCADLLDATAAVVAREPNARVKIQQLDSLVLTGPAVSDASTYANIVVARLYERLGDQRAALDAIRRRGYMSGWPRYLASARREEGRLALAQGDTIAAADVYRQYLALRGDAEPSAKQKDEPVVRFVAGLNK